MLLLLLVIPFASFSQPYYNSWIKYDQPYYKFKVAETGIFRIDYSTLVNAGVPVESINPKNLQLFSRGQEIPLYIQGEDDDVFNTTDFVEFYGERNDGWLDESFYGAAVDHPNPYYSLINDTIGYFLTWNNSVNNSRLVVETDVNFSSFTPVDYFEKEEVQYYSSTYYEGETELVGGASIIKYGYDPTEGWFDVAFGVGGSTTKDISTPNVFSSGPSASVSLVVLGESDYAPVTSGDHHLRITLGNVVIDSIFEGYEKIDVSFPVPVSELGASSTEIRMESIDDLSAGADRQALSFIRMVYPHTMDLEGRITFDNILVENSLNGPKSYLNFSNFSTSGEVFLYDLTNKKRIRVEKDGGNYKCLVPNSAEQKRCYLTSEEGVLTVSSLTPVNATGTFTNFIDNQEDSAFVIITHPSLLSEAGDYASYRQTSINNPENALVVNIEELYDQFSYGIEKHPYAIRGFMDYIVDNWSTAPKNMFLLGKSLKVKDTRNDVDLYRDNLVPSFGSPPSDHLLTAGLNGTMNEPLVPTGRLAANSGEQVTWYLDKVKEYENPVNGPFGETEWMKRVLHFAGGKNAGEASVFANNLNQYKSVIEDTLYGGTVNTYTKESSEPVQTIISDEIKDFIADGVSMMTFFGHASATGGFDQNIDDPADWPDQSGRYPFLLGNSCLTGDIHLPSSNSTSEKYVVIPNRGVIGFLASVDLGLASFLHQYSSEFYKQLSYKKYGKSVGEQITGTIKNIQGDGDVYFINATSLGMSLHGDPSIVIHTHSKPDYMIDASSVSYTPGVVTSDIDSFDVNILITNLGMAIADTIIVSLTREFPGGQFPDTTYIELIEAPKYQKTVVFKLPVDIVKGLGINNFRVEVDAFNLVDELFENNNEINGSLTIFSGELVPVYPYEYAIVPDQGIALIASTASALEPARDYIFEVDTTDYFNSPMLERTVINQSGGIVSWAPNVLTSMQDSMVYFWRVSKDSVDATGYNWREASFQYIPTKRGWEQDHFFQFEKDGYQFVQHNRASRTFDFVDNVKELKCIVYGASTEKEFNNNKLLLDAQEIAGNGYFTNASIHLAILDSLTLESWTTSDKNLGQVNPAGFSYFAYRLNDPLQMQHFVDAITDSVPDGYYMMAWTWTTSTFNQYAPLSLATKNAFQALGATQIPLAADSIPFCFFTKKGDISSALEVVGDSINHKNLTLSTTLTISADYGRIYSEKVGPASSWDTLTWKARSIEPSPSKDKTTLSVYGITNTGEEVLLLSDLPVDSSGLRLANQVDASTYPYLKLDALLEDDSLFTAPQLDRWHVTYEGIPEAALDPNTLFTLYNDTVDEGEEVELSIVVRNIGDYDMDSLLITFAVLDQNNDMHLLPYPRQAPLLVDSTLIVEFSFSSIGYLGLNNLLIDVNPDNDQPEMFHFNNLAQIPFYVESDKTNPILDVTFDGVHILDGDIVSPSAEIVMEVTDENPYLVLDDTSDYTVYITYPDGIEKRIYFGAAQETMQFVPATLPKNRAKIRYTGDFKSDGDYKLRVQATDRSNNASGSVDYVIGFEIVTKSTITNVINYPNPFTTSTRFVFTLTGQEIPEVFNIQIMTITGKVVRNITKEELGPIRIGRNISSFSWNGTDQYGDRLAKGLYLYRVTTRLNNEDLEIRQSAADGYFKKGIGKMYLLR